MKALYLDCFAGITGNMFLGALLNAGLPENILRENLSFLSLNGYQLSIQKVYKCGISSIYVDIKSENIYLPRQLATIFQTIDDSNVTPKIKDISKKIFMLLATAETKVHDVSLEEIYFHEMGNIEAIIATVGIAIGLDYLGIETIYTSTMQVGKGFTNYNQGMMPVPTPVTAELLKGIPYYNGGINKELVTPLGAALVAALSTGYGAIPDNFVSKIIGYGAGTGDLEIPNVLRIYVGQLINLAETTQTIVIEANIDDLNPQVFPYVMDMLLKIGVFDVWMTPIIMKKNRSATKLSVLVKNTLLDQVIAILFEETSTIGLRYHITNRKMAMREIIMVVTPWGESRVKVSSYDGKVCSVTPEYEDCKLLAKSHKVPLKKVQQEVLEAAWAIIKEDHLMGF